MFVLWGMFTKSCVASYWGCSYSAIVPNFYRLLVFLTDSSVASSPIAPIPQLPLT